MTYEWAKPGAKVVCVNSKDTYDILVENSIYQIRGVNILREESFFCGQIKKDSIVLTFECMDEIYTIDDGVNRIIFEGFDISRFRPLIEKKLPQSLTCLLKNPKSIILPNEGNQWDIRKEKVK